MVIEQRLSEEPNLHAIDEDIHVDEWANDVSTATSQEDECLEVVASDQQCAGTFGNIVIKNSSDVQFGNKTFYQGPVTIKQFVYKGVKDTTPLYLENCGQDNPTFLPECIIESQKECVISDKSTNKVNKNTDTVSDNAEVTKGAQRLNNLYCKRNFYFIALAVLLGLSLFIFTLISLTKHQYNIIHNDTDAEDNDEQETNEPVDSPIDPSNVTLGGKLRLVNRKQWVAQPAAGKVDVLKHPVPYVVILHTATENCSHQAECTFHIRYIQTFHIESNGWFDIAYNFLVGGDGQAYEGRGWMGVGAHTRGYNDKSIGIAFIGTFNSLLPPERQIKAAKQLIETGVKKGYISENYKLFAHRQLSSTQSPGSALFENIQTWPHWSLTP